MRLKINTKQYLDAQLSTVRV